MDSIISHNEESQNVINIMEGDAPKHYVPTEKDRKLLQFILTHTDAARDYRNQNYSDDWKRYERHFRGKWDAADKTRGSERSKVISPATQQAIETRHAEIMEAIFGQGDYFDIKDDLVDANGTKLDVEKLKAQLKEDFSQDKIRKSIESIALLAEIYGTGIGEIVISTQKQFTPMQMPVDGQMAAYGTVESERFSVGLTPINPNNFLFDPNGTSVEDCMFVAVEKYASIHKVVQGITEGKYRNIELSTMYKDDSLEATREVSNFKENKLLLTVYYGLVPRDMIDDEDEDGDLDSDDGLISTEFEDYEDMVESIVVVVNGNAILKAELSPYMMGDRPIVTYQSDTVPNRLLGRGTAEKAINMQVSIDGSIRSHMDSLALTSAPMMGMDSTRLPRGFKLEVKPGASILTNGSPSDILFPLKFGVSDGSQMETSKEFERMLLMATGTMDSAGQISQVSRDGNMDMATATMIKKYKRTLINFQEDFLIPFIYKAAWRYMQFDPERYPALDVKFIPTATLGIVAREYEQKQLAFLVQTLGANSPLTPILMQGIVENSSISNRQAMLAQMAQLSQQDPAQQQMAQQLQQQAAQLDLAEKQAKVSKIQAEVQQIGIDTQLAPDIAKAKIVSALSYNLDENNEGKDFERRAKIAELMLREKDLQIKENDIASNERIALSQMGMPKNQKSEEDRRAKEEDRKIKMEAHQMMLDEHNMKREDFYRKKRDLEQDSEIEITAPSGEVYKAKKKKTTAPQAAR